MPPPAIRPVLSGLGPALGQVAKDRLPLYLTVPIVFALSLSLWGAAVWMMVELLRG